MRDFGTRDAIPNHAVFEGKGRHFSAAIQKRFVLGMKKGPWHHLLPLQAEESPRLAKGRVHQVPQQLPDVGQRFGRCARRAYAEGHGPDRPRRVGAVCRDLGQRTQQAASTRFGEKPVLN